jgi:voltage-gated potassium channel
MFMGLTIFAIFTGTVSAFMVDRLRVEGRIVEFDELYNHIVICGWTPKTEVIIREYRAGKKTRRTPIVVVTEIPSEQLEAVARQLTGVLFIHDDFTKAEALERAGIAHAQSCLVLSDTHGGRSEQDADARTLLAALSVEKMNEKVYTCAELNNRSYATHLHLGKVNDFVVSSEYGAHMLAQAAMKRGLLNVVSELLTYERGNEFYRVDVPETWVGQSFDEKLSDVRNSMNIILIAVHSRGQDAIVNPENYRFQRDDEVVVISRHEPKLV